MYLTTAESVIDRMGIASGGGSLEAARNALHGVTPILEHDIGTTFTQRDYQDNFDYQPAWSDSFRPVILFLSNGYLDGDTGVSVYYSLDNQGIFKPSSSNSRKLLKTEYYFNAEKGIVTLLIPPPKGIAVIAIKYTAGFSKATDDPDLFTGVPESLKEAAISLAIFLFHGQASSFNKKSLADKSYLVKDQVSRVVNPLVRPRMNGVFPSYAIVNE